MVKKIRTNQQNKAIHLLYNLLAESLNEAGFDMKKTLREDFDIPWTAYNIKEFMWRPVQLAVCGKKSTTQLTTKDINDIYDIIMKAIGERTGSYIPFPSIEELMNNNLQE